MTSPLRALEAAAMLLPPEERAKLAERLMASLETDPEAEAAWEKEIERRIAAFEAGLYEEHPVDDVLAEARERI